MVSVTCFRAGRPVVVVMEPMKFDRVGKAPLVEVTDQDLKSALWNAANILRGSAVDRTDWKGYILPLLFFKRISDAWDEETADAADTFGEADPSVFPEVHRFTVPTGCLLNRVSRCSTAGSMLPVIVPGGLVGRLDKQPRRSDTAIVQSPIRRRQRAGEMLSRYRRAAA